MRSVPIVLFLIFMTLRLTEQIDWSWWWVAAPLWIPVAAGLLAVVVCVLFVKQPPRPRRPDMLRLLLKDRESRRKAARGL